MQKEGPEMIDICMKRLRDIYRFSAGARDRKTIMLI